MGRMKTIITPPEKLKKDHNVKKFNCGNPELNAWLQSAVAQDKVANTAITFVVRYRNKVIAYYSLAIGSIENQPLQPETSRIKKSIQRAKSRIKKRLQPSKKREKNEFEQQSIPVIIISRLAVDIKYQGLGIGKSLLKDAILRTLNASEQSGIKIIFVHAKDEKSLDFYHKFGFEPCPIDPFKMMLLLKNVQNITTSSLNI
jgi:GNAT superfamily N-acetyltransferase